MRRALLRCLCLGAVLFAAERAWRGSPGSSARPPASADDALLREALALGLERQDAVVARRLAQNMSFLESGGGSAEQQRTARSLGMPEEDLVVRRRLVERARALLAGEPSEPGEAALREYVEAHVTELSTPAMTSITQIDLGTAPPSPRGVREILTRIEPEARAIESSAAGAPVRLPPKTRDALAKMFGDAFAAAVDALPVGEWSGPLRSAYGFHLVRVEARMPPRRPEFAVVRSAARAAILAENRRARLDLTLPGGSPESSR